MEQQDAVDVFPGSVQHALDNGIRGCCAELRFRDIADGNSIVRVSGRTIFVRSPRRTRPHEFERLAFYCVRQAGVEDTGFFEAGHAAFGIAAEGEFLAAAILKYIGSNSGESVFGFAENRIEVAVRYDLHGSPGTIRVGSDVIGKRRRLLRNDVRGECEKRGYQEPDFHLTSLALRLRRSTRRTFSR